MTLYYLRLTIKLIKPTHPLDSDSLAIIWPVSTFNSSGDQPIRPIWTATSGGPHGWVDLLVLLTMGFSFPTQCDWSSVGLSPNPTRYDLWTPPLSFFSFYSFAFSVWTKHNCISCSGKSYTFKLFLIVLKLKTFFV